MNKPAIDVVLLNLGTPEAASLPAVRRFLREFLADERVIDVAKPLRWLLLYGVFLPFRSHKTARAYQKIWTPAGSPLLVNSEHLRQALAEELGSDFRVSLAMRYGQPSIEDTLKTLLKNQACQQLIILPLYPQYSSAASGTALAKALDTISQNNTIPAMQIINHFYDDPLFIQAYAAVIQENLAEHPVEKLIFSYHGLPERHIDNAGCSRQYCDRIAACPEATRNTHYCYRQQCFTTSRLLARALELSTNQYQVAFQSRLGKLPWIKPYTEQLLIELRQQGIVDIAIVSPSFVCDCLETLEELGIRAQEQWRELGGNYFKLIPCLNAHPLWVRALKRLILTKAKAYTNLHYFE